MRGENFTQEYKYPIKIYRIWEVEFANGVEVRKMVFSVTLGTFLFFLFIFVGIKSDTNIWNFLIKNWLILVTVIPGVITFVVFNLKYDNKGFIPYIRDRVQFYKTRHKAYEHYMEVPVNQMQKDLEFEPFIIEKEGES